MTTPIWLSIQNACEIARFAGIQGPYSVRLTTANAEELIEELKSSGKPAEIVWRVGERLLSLRASGVQIVVDDDAVTVPGVGLLHGAMWDRLNDEMQNGARLEQIKKKLSLHDIRTMIQVMLP